MRCDATTASGGRCRRTAAHGTTRCHQHEAPEHRRARTGRLALAAVVQALAFQQDRSSAWTGLLIDDYGERVDGATETDLVHALEWAAQMVASAWLEFEERLGEPAADRAWALGEVLTRESNEGNR